MALRRAEQETLAYKTRDGSASIEDYWRYRCASVQIEFIHERLKVLWNTFGMSGMQSARATIHVDNILKRKAGIQDFRPS